MMAAAIQKQDLDLWAARNDIVTVMNPRIECGGLQPGHASG